MVDGNLWLARERGAPRWLQRGLERAAKEAGENDRIVVCGSFYTVAAALGAQQSELR